MPMNAHEEARLLIDRCLAAEASDEERSRLQEHLDACPDCRRSRTSLLSLLQGFGGLAFDIEPGASARVQAAVARRARDLGRERRHRRRMTIGLALALAMTAAGSFAVWVCAGWLAGAGRIAPAGLAVGVTVFWMLPSLCAALLLLTPQLFTRQSQPQELAL
jgi:hypothetical protein